MRPVENLEQETREIERMMREVTGRPVQVSFSLLGQYKNYTVAIQKTLFEFDGEASGPKGVMYVTFNRNLLMNEHGLRAVAGQVARKYKGA